MDIFKNEHGYVPLVPNLEGYWERSLRELPADLAALVKKRFFAAKWESLDPQNRRAIATQLDYQNDPNHEPSTYFKLVELAEDLKAWIAKAKIEGKDPAVVAFREVADRVEDVLELDRARVGSEIKQLRELQARAGGRKGAQVATGGGDELPTRARDTLLKLVIGMAISRYGYDPRKGKSPVTKRIVDDLASLGIPLSDDTVLKWLRQANDAVLTGDALDAR